jgi:hypothetical protein
LKKIDIMTKVISPENDAYSSLTKSHSVLSFVYSYFVVILSCHFVYSLCTQSFCLIASHFILSFCLYSLYIESSGLLSFCLYSFCLQAFSLQAFCPKSLKSEVWSFTITYRLMPYKAFKAKPYKVEHSIL